MKKTLRSFLFLITLSLPVGLFAQAEVFGKADFELRGPVKSCTVITSYGEERFEFKPDGRLIKSVTLYNAADYDVTHYRYKNDSLIEKRDEVYRDGSFEKPTSFARFYERDTLSGLKVTEKILSYDRQIQEQYTHYYDPDTLLRRIVWIHEGSIDETLLEYSEAGDAKTVNYLLNGQLEKSVRYSVKNDKEGPLNIKLVKDFFKGTPQKAVEQARDSSGKLIWETRFIYDAGNESFRKELTIEFTYMPEGFIKKEISTYWGAKGKPSRVNEKTYLYQMDGRQPGNWIKKIITPDNSYFTRKITYYKPLENLQKDSVPE